MTRDHQTLQSRLVAQQPIDEASFQNYRHAVDQMFIEKLGPARRTHLAIRILFGLAIAGYIVYDLAANRTQPLHHLIIDAVIVLVAIVWSAYLLRDFLNASMDRRKRGKIQAFLQLGLIVIIAAATFIAAAAAPDTLQSIRVLTAGAVFLVIVSVLHLRGQIRNARMDLEQRNLELQLRIAALTESLTRKESHESL
ncbi:MAG TPA: hypothetical protein VHQ47_13150 [Phycisphaerae bacterium]|jgi:hypothetical protein|nr:hypothetical protein [Phycisphaerae bacterium]